MLRVDNEDAGRTDGHVVDLRAAAARPADIVQHVVSELAEPFERGADGLPADLAAFPEVGSVIGCVGAAGAFGRLGSVVLRALAHPGCLLTRRTPPLPCRLPFDRLDLHPCLGCGVTAS